METGVVEATSVLVRGVPRNFLGVGVQICFVLILKVIVLFFINSHGTLMIA